MNRLFTSLIYAFWATFSSISAIGIAVDVDLKNAADVERCCYLGDGTNFLKTKPFKIGSDESHVTLSEVPATTLETAMLFKLFVAQKTPTYLTERITIDGNSIKYHGATDNSTISNFGTSVSTDWTTVKKKFRLPTQTISCASGCLFTAEAGSSNNRITYNTSGYSFAIGTNLMCHEIPDTPLTVGEANTLLKGSFGLTFHKTVEDNPLTSNVLTAVPVKATALTGVAATATEYFLRVSGNFKGFTDYNDAKAEEIAEFQASTFVVVDTLYYSSFTIGTENAYIYKVVSGSEIIKTIGSTNYMSNVAIGNATTLSGTGAPTIDPQKVPRLTNNAIFQLSTNRHVSGMKLYSPHAMKPIANNTLPCVEGHTVPMTKKCASLIDFLGKNYLTLGDRTPLYFGMFSSTNLSKWAGKTVNIEFVATGRNPLKDRALWAGSVSNDQTTAANVERIDFTKPKGQLLISASDLTVDAKSANALTFINRENQVIFQYAQLQDGDNGTLIGRNRSNNMDTLKLTVCERKSIYDGYADFDRRELADQTLVFTLKTDQLGDVYTVAPASKERSVMLDLNKDLSTIWTLEKRMRAGNGTTSFTDSIVQAYTYNAWDPTSAKYVAKKDSTVMFAYTIKNATGSLGYSNVDDKDSYVLGGEKRYFVLKEKFDTHQLIPSKIGGSTTSTFGLAGTYTARSLSKHGKRDGMGLQPIGAPPHIQEACVRQCKHFRAKRLCDCSDRGQGFCQSARQIAHLNYIKKTKKHYQ